MKFISTLVILSAVIGHSLGLGQESTLTFSACGSGLQLARHGLAPTIKLADNEWPGVIRAAEDLATDFGRVIGTNGTIWLSNSTSVTKSPSIIIAGTIGKSTLLDSLISSGKLNVAAIKGKWESFSSQVVSNPIAGTASALVIAGSDKRGTIYGLYDISEQMGVSPWYWWADVPPKTKTSICAGPKSKTQGPPTVKYRGIFINDEAPSLSSWVRANYPNSPYGAGYNANFYSKVFELLLRLKANYLWPAMWDNMFYVDDTHSGAMADYYGIVMGTSHTEPMARATKEQGMFLTGSWDWSTNAANLKTFMADGVTRAEHWDTLYTMGMRGSGDVASPTLTPSELEEIIAYQQSLLKSTFGSNVSSVPQMWCLYKEVAAYFQAGMTVPEDIILLWSDDNVGNIQRLPLSNETSRSGGAGVYYHFDYVGSPRNYKWINTVQLAKTWEQMHLAAARDATQMWIVNVGDIKGLELPINHFMDMAYDMSKFGSADSTNTWIQLWSNREFGTSIINQAAIIMQRYGQLIVRRKYELLSLAPIYSTVYYNEAEKVLQEWTDLLKIAQLEYDLLDSATKPSFFEMVLHPVLAGKTVQEIYIKAALNSLYASQGRISANSLANQVESAFAADASITARYHALFNGKWNHMMDQVHIGYTTWSDPAVNTMPNVAYISGSSVSLSNIMGVAVEGNLSTTANHALTLTSMNPYMAYTDTRYIDIYAQTNGSFSYTLASNVSYVSFSQAKGTITSPGPVTDIRSKITVDWTKAPTGLTYALITVSQVGSGSKIDLTLPINHTSVSTACSKCFIESNGVISMEAAHYASTTSGSSSASYANIPWYGRTFSGLTLQPANIPSLTTTTAPKLSYKFYTFTSAAKASLTIYLASSLNTDPTRPLKYAFSLDGGAVTTVQPVPNAAMGSFPSGWTLAVEQGTWTSKSTGALGLATAGAHTLDLWALEPGVVFDKLVIDLGGVKTSYLGPPESHYSP